MIYITMARIGDRRKLAPKEEAALKKFYGESKAKHGDRFLTLTKDERTAKYIMKQQMAEQGATQANPGDLKAQARRDEKYGRAEWEPPDLTMPLPKGPSPVLWETIERFVQLSDSTLEDFQRRFPAFFPAWFYSLPCGNDAEHNVKTGLLAWQAWRSLLRGAWHSGFHPEYVSQLVNIPSVPPGNTRFEVQPVSDAQRAVLAMALESWRARFCPKCGRPFVARRAANKFCSTDCFAQQRREKQRAAKRYRARKRKAKAQARGRVKR